ncbi:MAG: hypothetical protein C0412_02945 [Flavobacterium sp.]|nr:hypothetical protein [Flavobacterium sp.]
MQSRCRLKVYFGPAFLYIKVTNNQTGVYRIFFIPLLGGLLIGSLYYSFKKQPTLMKLAFYAIFLFGLIFSFFNSPFGFLWYVYNLTAIFFVFRYIKSTARKT